MMIRPRNKWGFRRGGRPTRPCRSSAKVRFRRWNAWARGASLEFAKPSASLTVSARAGRPHGSRPPARGSFPPDFFLRAIRIAALNDTETILYCQINALGW